MIQSHIKLTRAFATVAPTGALVQLLSLGSSLVLAARLGATTHTDAYYLALSVPLVASVVLMTGIRLGGIPVLTELRDRRPEAFSDAASALVAASLVGTLAATAIATAVSIAVLPAVSGGSPHFASLTRLFLLELAPYAVSAGLIGTLGSLLAARGRFAIVTAVLGIEPILKSLLLILFSRQLGVQALIIGTVAGNLLAGVVLWVAVRRRGIVIGMPRWTRSKLGLPMIADDGTLRRVFALSTPLILSQLVLQLNPVIDRTTATAVGAGSVTEFEFGLRIFSGPTALLLGSMIAPLAAGWSERLARGGWDEVISSYRRLAAAVFLIITPLVVMGVLLRHDLISVLYHTHRFSASAVTNTSNVFAALLLGLGAQVLIVPLSTLFVIRGDTIFPMKVGILNCILNGVLDVTLRGPLGVGGIAASTSITYAALCCLYIWRAGSRWGSLGTFRAARTILLPAGLGGLIVAGITVAGRDIFMPVHSRWGELLLLAGTVTLATAAYAVIVAVTGGLQRVGWTVGRRRGGRPWTWRTSPRTSA